MTPLGAGVAAALALAVPALGAPPVRDSFAVTVPDAVSCAGFAANIERSFSGRVTAYFDQQRNLTRLQVVAEMRGSVTNSVTGKSVALRGHIVQVVDAATGSTAFVGAVFMGNAPGAGSVIQETGRIVFAADGSIAFEAGPHDVIDSNGDVFCRAVG
jgi:hypothetical protein